MLKEIIIAFQSFEEANQFIRKHKMFKWIIIPGIIYTLMFIVAMILFARSANDAVTWLSLQLQIEPWLQQERSPLLAFIFVMAGIMLRLVLFLFYFSLFKYLILIIGSPVFAYLSEKTEAIIDNREYKFNLKQILPDAKRAMQLALRNAGWQTVYMIGLIFLSLIPVIGWITPLIAIIVECYYYGFSMLDYGLAKNDFTIQKSIFYSGRHKGLSIGNGIVFYMMHVVVIFAPAFAIIASSLSVMKVKTD
ncbi:MAG TPA: EI24 domain-containing protein [Chitinophagaceae bacterium]|nr:EI24 domain-containing protein [Chitinophagaceae bacterium]